MVSINEDNRTEIGVYKKAFSIFMALYPLLCIYKGVSSFTIGDLILIVFFFVALYETLYKKSNNNISKILCAIFIVMFFGNVLFYNYMVFWYFSLIIARFSIRGGVILLTVLLLPLFYKHLQKIFSLFAPYIRYLVCHSSKKYRRCEI